MVERRLPRVQEVIFPVLRAELPDVKFGSWTADVDFRRFPLVNVRRLGGLDVDPEKLGRAVIEMTAYSRDGIVATENLYLDCRQVLYNMVKNQIVVPGVGHLSSFRDTMGMTPFDSPFDDTWRVQGLIQLGIRPPKQ